MSILKFFASRRAVARLEAAIEDLVRRGPSDDLCRAYLRLLELQPRRVEILIALARALMGLGHFEQAEEYAECAVAEAPEGQQQEARALRAQVRAGSEHRSESGAAAVGEVEGVRANDDEGSDPIIHRGEEVFPGASSGELEGDADDDLLVDGELSMGGADFEFDIDSGADREAAAPDPDPAEEPEAGSRDEDPDLLYAEASVYLRYGKTDQAIATLRAALDQQPNWPAALEKLGEAHLDAGDPSNAQSAWTKTAHEAERAGDWEASLRLKARLGATDENENSAPVAEERDTSEPQVVIEQTQAPPPDASQLPESVTEEHDASDSHLVMPPSSRSDDDSGEGDAVDCTLFAPQRLRLGETFLLQAFAHVPERAAEASEMAVECDEDAMSRGTKSLDTRLTTCSSSWRLTAPMTPGSSSARSRSHRAVFRSVGRILFSLNVVERSASLGLDRADESVGEAKRYRNAFISYAAPDRGEVLRRVQMLGPLKICFFQDALDLDPGDRWAEELCRHIYDADVLFLFWSSASRASEWVRKEVQYAIERKGGEEDRPPDIIPILLEGPPGPSHRPPSSSTCTSTTGCSTSCSSEPVGARVATVLPLALAVTVAVKCERERVRRVALSVGLYTQNQCLCISV